MLRTVNLVALAAAMLVSTPALALAGPGAADAGYFMVQGRQVFLLAALPGMDLAERGSQIRRRLEAAISKDGTIQPVGVVSLTDVAGTPVVSVGQLPIASVTAADAARAGQPAWTLAHCFAASLEEALTTLRVGGPVPERFAMLKSTTGSFVPLVGPSDAMAAASAPDSPPGASGAVATAPGSPADGASAPLAGTPAADPGPLAISLCGGRITATIQAGVVTLSGQAATLAEKMDVAQRVAAVPGVVDVINHVTVSSERRRSDAELAAALGTVAR